MAKPLSYSSHSERRITKLIAIRWTGQFTDGVFQSALASFVLFSPERQPDARSAAAAFAVVLLPYSFVGPLVGTILDRFSRQRIILIANALRALSLVVISLLIKNGATGVELTVFVLIAFGINRLILAGLSASLPLLLDTRGEEGRNRLVSINALAVTGGTVCVVLGGGFAIAIRKFLDSHTTADSADSILVTIAAALFALAAILALTFHRSSLGPYEHEIKKERISVAYREMLDGFRFLRSFRDCYLGIFATAIQRSGLTALTLMALLLNRNTFNDPSLPEQGLAGFATAVTVAGVGVGVGALIAPLGVRRFGRHLWIRISLISGAIPLLLLAMKQVEGTLLAAAFFAALAGQGVKVTNDALVQSKISDEFRGRVFAVYDVLVNAGIVTGAMVASLFLPQGGKSLVVPLIVATTYLFIGILMLQKKNFNSDYRSTI